MSEHRVDRDKPPKDVRVGDTLIVSSRGKKAWVARVTRIKRGKTFKTHREFLLSSVSVGGMNKQIVSYSFEIPDTGNYEMSGDEFGEFRYTFKVES